MDEVAFAHINANVAESPAHGVEKHQIARFQVGAVNFFGCGCLLGGAAGENQSCRLFENGSDKSATVETGVAAGAAALVGHTQKAYGIDDQFRGFCLNFFTNIANPGQQTTVSSEVPDIVCCRQWIGI